MSGKSKTPLGSHAQIACNTCVAVVAGIVATGIWFAADTTGRTAQAGPASIEQALAAVPVVEEPPSPPFAEPPRPTETSAPRYTFNLGDRVKISIYGRQDLPSDYRVNAKGQIAVPTVGIFDVTSATPQDLEAMVTAVLHNSVEQMAFVTVEPLEPVFVTGLVSKPGAYAYTDGMIAIQATALAGGELNAASASYLPTEAIREAAHMRSTELELAGLIATRARLTAQRSGTDTIAIPPQLIQLVGASKTEELIGREQLLLEQERLSNARQRQSLESAIKEADTEIAAYQDELVYINKQRKLRVSITEPLQELAKKGLTTQQRVADSELMLVSLDRDAQNAIANMSRARQSLERSERDLVLLNLDFHMQADKQLRDTEELIAKAQASREGSARFVSYIAGMPTDTAAGTSRLVLTLEIMRKEKDGTYKKLAASEKTRLMPGDVLKVGSTSAE